MDSMTKLSTPRGDLSLPAFLPDATRGAVRALDSEDLSAIGVDALVVNTYHLSHSPGTKSIERLGGIHSFMGWRGLVFADSGGFQIFSLLEDRNLQGKVTAKGFDYRRSGRGSRTLSPEKSILWQHRLGADVLVCLDHCTHPDADSSEQLQSVEHTVSWARDCKLKRDQLADRTGRKIPLFAVIQGGRDRELRRRCTDCLLELGFDGYAFGGWPVGPSGQLLDAVHFVAELVPREIPLWGLGIGKPENLVAAFRSGYRLFDCVLPTRDARHGRMYVFNGNPIDSAPTFYEHVYLADGPLRRSRAPLDPNCPGLCCRRFSRAYLGHLHAERDPLAMRLATIHNLCFYLELVKRLRIENDQKPDR